MEWEEGVKNERRWNGFGYCFDVNTTKGNRSGCYNMFGAYKMNEYFKRVGESKTENNTLWICTCVSVCELGPNY